MPRVVILGCGTGVGKTRVSTALLHDLARHAQASIGLKPIESGYTGSGVGSDALALADAGSISPLSHLPRYAFEPPLSPHLAARDTGQSVDLSAVRLWCLDAGEHASARLGLKPAVWSIIETAGGVFSPLNDSESNFELARQLDPSVWVLVASDSLGVLHEVSATLQAMAARGRAPDHLVLSGARDADASTGRNAAELERLGIAKVSAVLARHKDDGVSALTEALVRASSD